MPATLYAHPFSSYCQKALIALYETATPFALRLLGPDDPSAMEELAALWPHQKFPVLVDGDRTLVEASIIVEHVDRQAGGGLIPADPDAALETRMMDRVFDNYVHTPQQRIVYDSLRPADRRDPAGVEEARAMLETSYAWLDARMAQRDWAAGDAFTLADCSAGPGLFYADWTHRIDARFTHLHAYRERLKARPSFARCIEEARSYRALFPLGAPDRD